MERRAEINRFAIFLFCLLLPLGSSAPTETSERKMTTGQKCFTTDIPFMSAVIKDRARKLFEFYQKCVSAPQGSVSTTVVPEPWHLRSEARNMSETIVKCPAFNANCCVLHHINNILKTLENDIETICKDSQGVVKANTMQLDTTLRQGTAFYTCKVQDLPQITDLDLAKRKIDIWWVLKKYDDVMQNAVERQDEKNNLKMPVKCDLSGVTGSV